MERNTRKTSQKARRPEQGNGNGSLRSRRSRQRKRQRNGIAVVVVFFVAIGIFWLFAHPKPEFVVNGGNEINAEYGQEYVDAGAEVTYKGNDISDSMVVKNTVDTSKLDTYKVVYKVRRYLWVYKETRIVHVVDSTPPAITLNGDAVMTLAQLSDYSEPGATAEDNYDGDMTSKLDVSVENVNEYTNVVHYTVTDSNGNTGKVDREVMTQDLVPPTIALNGDETVSLKLGENFEDPGATASDDRDGDISAGIQTDGYVDIYRSGKYTVTYTVADQGGNTASVSRTVNIQSPEGEQQSAIYLTFDDGPDTEVTTRILDILKSNGVKATFFICDYTEAELPLIQRMVDEGHTIGIHGYSHDYDKIYQSADTFMENIYSLRNKVKEDTGYEAFVIRFPGGSSNTVSKKYCPGIMTELVQRVTAEGLMYQDWNVSSGDAEGNNRPVDILINNVKSGLKQGRGNVVLMHDIGTKKTTADALQSVIDYGKSSGYTFFPISQDTIPVHHGVNN